MKLCTTLFSNFRNYIMPKEYGCISHCKNTLHSCNILADTNNKTVVTACSMSALVILLPNANIRKSLFYTYCESQLTKSKMNHRYIVAVIEFIQLFKYCYCV